MARHKPAAEGGYQRGEETRARIIEAAVEVFGERGYDGASTRAMCNSIRIPDQNIPVDKNSRKKEFIPPVINLE